MSDETNESVPGCPACGQDMARSDRTCERCWKVIPVKLRIALVTTYRHRVRNQSAYQEALAALLIWCHEYRIREWTRVA